MIYTDSGVGSSTIPPGASFTRAILHPTSWVMSLTAVALYISRGNGCAVD